MDDQHDNTRGRDKPGWVPDWAPTHKSVQYVNQTVTTFLVLALAAYGLYTLVKTRNAVAAIRSAKGG